jgi:hypothetical protein
MHVRYRLFTREQHCSVPCKELQVMLTRLQMAVQMIRPLIGPMAHEASMLLPGAAGGRRGFTHRRAVPHVCRRSEWTVGLGGWWPIVDCGDDLQEQLPEAWLVLTASNMFSNHSLFIS